MDGTAAQQTYAERSGVHFIILDFDIAVTLITDHTPYGMTRDPFRFSRFERGEG